MVTPDFTNSQVLHMMNNINLQIDAAARQVSQNGKAVYLTQTEFDLLLYLLDNAGRITTRSELLAQVWGITAPIHTRTVDMHIAKLRHKLGAQIEITSVMRKGYVTKKA